MTLRVLHVGKFYPPQLGGMEVFLAELVGAQREQGIDAFALVHGTPLPGDPDWLLRVPVQFNLAYAPFAIGFRFALHSVMDRFQPHVLHLHMPNNSVFWALTSASARDVPWVVHWHSDVVFPAHRKLLSLAYRLYRPFEKAVLNHADRIVVTSPAYLAASEPLSRWRDKCIVVPLGVGRAPAVPAHDSGAALPWRAGALRLLSVGRLTYYKGFETLIRAVAGVADVQLLIAGAGESAAGLQALIEDTTPESHECAVTLLGEVSDDLKHQLLRSCDVFCLASRERTEAFGLVLLEAMLHGRPCLVSDLPGSGMPWLVQQARCGEVVALENEAAWREAIESARDPGRRLQWGEAGRRAFEQNYTIEACAATLRSHYGALTGEAQQSPRPDDILIVIPARDEAATLGALVETLKQAGWADVLVVDDHSSDETGTIAAAAGAQVLRPVLRMGAWGAMQSGIRYARSQGYEAVITMDADGQHEVEEIPQLLRMREHADLVIGAFPQRASKARRIAWRWFIKLTGLDLEDLTSGFRYYSAAAMEVLASDEATLLDYQDVGTLLMLRRAGLRILEVPVAMQLRTLGKSRVFNSWLSVGRYMALTTLLCLSRWKARPTARG